MVQSPCLNRRLPTIIFLVNAALQDHDLRAKASPRGDVLRSDVESLAAELRRRGFDLRRSALVTYLLELGGDRDGAYAIRDSASADGWRASLFGDASGWVVRLTRLGLARQQLLDRDATYLEGLTQAYGGTSRGVCVEDPAQDGIWDTLVAQVCERERPDDEQEPRVPAPRRAADRQGEARSA